MPIDHAKNIASTLIYRKRRVELLRNVTKKRLLPAFDSIMTEAIAVTDAEFARLKEIYKGDPNRYINWEDAWDACGRDYFKDMDNIKVAIVNMIVSALFHQFEQELWNVFQWVVTDTTKAKSAVAPLLDIVRALQAHGLDCTTFTSWPKIKELRLIANVIKHGEGRSSQELTALRPPLTRCAGVRDSAKEARVFHVSILAGNSPALIKPIPALCEF